MCTRPRQAPLTMAALFSMLVGCGGGGGLTPPDAGPTSRDGDVVLPDGRVVPPGLDDYLAENGIARMERMADGTERGFAITGADGRARFFSERHEAVFALDLVDEADAAMAGLEVTVTATDTGSVLYLAHDPSGTHMPLFFAGSVLASGQHELSVDGAALLTDGVPVLDFDPSAGNPFTPIFTFVGISVSISIRGILVGIGTGIAIDLLKDAITNTCRFFAPVHVELCNLIAQVAGYAAEALGGIYFKGATAFGALVDVVEGEVRDLVCEAVGGALVTYVEHPEDTMLRERYRELAYRYNYLLYRLENEPPAGMPADTWDRMADAGGSLASIAPVVRNAYFEIHNTSTPDSLAHNAIERAVEKTVGALEIDHVFREWVLTNLTIEEGYAAYLGIGPSGTTFAFREWTYVSGEFEQWEFEEGSPLNDVLGPLTECGFAIVKGLRGELDDGVRRSTIELDAEGLVGVLIDLWSARLNLMHADLYGEDIPPPTCLPDEYEPNGSWMAARAAPVPVMLGEGDLVTLPDQTLCPVPGGTVEEDWYAYDIGPIELMVQAGVSRDSGAPGYDQELCLEIHFISEIYDIFGDPPTRVAGPVCGTGGLISTPTFGIRRTLGESWSMLLVRVFPGAGATGPFEYELRFTP